MYKLLMDLSLTNQNDPYLFIHDSSSTPTICLGLQASGASPRMHRVRDMVLRGQEASKPHGLTYKHVVSHAWKKR